MGNGGLHALVLGRWAPGVVTAAQHQRGAGDGGQQTAGTFPTVDDATLTAIGAAIQAGEIPVGGATFFSDAGVVVTQPQQGSYVALSTMCTHEGQLIDRVIDGQLACPAHGSRFDPASGAATRSPAQTALPTKPVTVTGGKATLA